MKTIADCRMHPACALRTSGRGVNGLRNDKHASPAIVWVRSLAAFLGAVLFLSLSLPFSARAELVDRVVASVNNDVITLSELDHAVEFNAALGGRNDARLREETLEGLINRQLLIQEAFRLKFVEISDQDVDAEVEKLKKRLGSEQAFADFLKRLDMNGQELRRMLGDRLLAERFIEKKIGLFVHVSREDAQDYFTGHSGEFKGKQFPEVQKAITAMLSAQKFDQEAAQYLAELKGRAEIRMNP